MLKTHVGNACCIVLTLLGTLCLIVSVFSMTPEQWYENTLSGLACLTGAFINYVISKTS